MPMRDVFSCSGGSHLPSDAVLTPSDKDGVGLSEVVSVRKRRKYGAVSQHCIHNMGLRDYVLLRT